MARRRSQVRLTSAVRSEDHERAAAELRRHRLRVARGVGLVIIVLLLIGLFAAHVLAAASRSRCPRIPHPSVARAAPASTPTGLPSPPAR